MPARERCGSSRSTSKTSGDTYGEIARRLGEPEAARAVGHANACNPIALIVPCHRVIGSDGDLTGYAGGLDRKKWLLDMESGQTRLDF
jgi:methylated-DNA-[protein]-cysteine S-methyltransferase